MCQDSPEFRRGDGGKSGAETQLAPEAAGRPGQAVVAWGFALIVSKTDDCGYGRAQEEGMPFLLYGQEIKTANPRLCGRAAPL